MALVPVDYDPFAAASAAPAQQVDADGFPLSAPGVYKNPDGTLHIVVSPRPAPTSTTGVDFGSSSGGLLGGSDQDLTPSVPKTIFDQALQGATGNFADEVTDPLGAFMATLYKDPEAALSKKGEATDPDLVNQIADAPANTQKELSAEAKNNPGVSLLSNVGGSILPAVAGGAVVKGIGTGFAALGLDTPAAITAFTAKHPKVAKYLASSFAGGGGGSVYAAGASTGGVSDRVNSAESSALPSAAGGLAGGLLAEKVGNAVAPIKNYIGGLLGADAGSEAGTAAGGVVASPVAGSPVPAPPDETGGLLGQRLSDQELANLSQGKVLPLTSGDRTQNTARQRAERTAEEAGSEPILNARAKQRAAALAPFTGALGPGQVIQPADLSLTAQDSAHKVAGILGDIYDQMGSGVNAAYKKADEIGGAQLPIGAVAETDAGASLMDRLYTTIALEGVTDEQMPDLYGAVDKLQKIVDDVKQNGQFVTTVKELENWKKNAFNRIDPMKQGIKPGEASRILKLVNQEYEGFLDDTVQSGIVEGEQGAIDAFRNARGLARDRFKFYQTEKGIQKLLDDREMSGTDLVNVVFGAGKEAGRGQVGNRAELMLQLAGDRATEMKSAMQRGTMAKILQASIFPSVDASNPTVNSINFSGMHAAMNKLIANKEFFNAVFDDTEQQYLKTFNEDLRLIGSAQKGVINGSGTGARVADIVNGIGRVVNNPIFKHLPVVGAASSMIQHGLTTQAESIITGKAEKGLQEFGPQAAKLFNAPAAYYGGYSGGVLENERAMQNEDQK